MTKLFDLKDLPTWIKESSFIEIFILDYPDETYIEIEEHKVFYFPALNLSNIKKVLEI